LLSWARMTRIRAESSLPVDLPQRLPLEIAIMASDDQDDLAYTVVVNHEKQYSIWPAGRVMPAGWKPTGKTGRKDECLQYIESVWTDMRPLSLRRRADEIENPTADGLEEPLASVDREQCSQEPSLVERLSSGQHPVEAALRPVRSAWALKECIDRQRMPIRFTQTRGQMELCMNLDKAATVTHLADFENAQGTVHLEGELTLNGARVRCIVDLDVATLSGNGHLVSRVDPSTEIAPEPR
jgi:uncharacterized protein YbdZ (MbtH family)